MTNAVVSELESLIPGLEDIMKKEQFKLRTNRNTDETLKKDFNFIDDGELIVYRASKMTTALQFVEKISMLGKIIKVDKYISEIERLNKSMAKIIEPWLATIEGKIRGVKEEIIMIIPYLQEYRSQKERYENE